MKIQEKFKYAIFDVDGTIFNNMPLSADAFLETIAEFKLPEKEIREIYLETNGMNLNDQFKLVFGKYGIKYNSALIGKLNGSFFGLRDNSPEWKNSPLFPGIKELLEKLRENSVKNFVSSGSNTGEVESRLKNAEILEYFDLMMGAEKIPKGAGHIKKFAGYCGISPEEFSRSAFLISDGPNDMILAKKSGIFAIGITNTVKTEKLKSSCADLIIENAGELLKLDFTRL